MPTYTDDFSTDQFTHDGTEIVGGDLINEELTAAPTYTTRGRATSGNIITGANSISTLGATISKKPGGRECRVSLSDDNYVTEVNSEGDDVSNSGGYEFDGVNDGIQIAHNSALDAGNGSWSYGCWFKAPNENQSRYLISKRNPGAPHYEQWTLGISGSTGGGVQGKKIAYIHQQLNTSRRNGLTNAEFADDSWHHVMAVFNSSANSVTIYVDGLSAPTTTSNAGGWPNVTTNDPMYIGRLDVGFYFKGGIDDVRVYNNAMSAADVWTLYSTGHDDNSANLVDRWRLDGNYNSDSGSHNGTAAAAPTSITDWSELPAYGNVLGDVDVPSFDQVNDSFIGSPSNYRSGDSGGTISAWMNMRLLPTSTSQFLFSVGGGTGYVSVFLASTTFGAGKLGIQISDGAGTRLLYGNTVVNPQEWSHVAVTSDGSEYELYVDGVAQTLTVHTGANDGTWFDDLSGADRISVGAFNIGTPSLFFGGLIANVSVHSEPLSAAQIQADYLNGYPSATDLVNWWPLADGSGNATDLVGGITLSQSGATWVKASDRPLAATPANESLDISGAGLTDLYVRFFEQSLHDGNADTAMALTQYTVVYDSNRRVILIT